MKFFTKKGLFKKLILVLIVLMVFNAVVPSHQVFAASSDKSFGGTLLKPIVDLLLGLGDIIINIIHNLVFGMNSSTITIDLDESIIQWLINILVFVAVAIAIGAFLFWLSGAIIPTLITGMGKVVGLFGLTMAEASTTLSAAAVGSILLTSAVTGGLAATYANSKFFGKEAVLPIYQISPEEIFAGEVGLLDVNFFKDGTEDEDTSMPSESATIYQTVSEIFGNNINYGIGYKDGSVASADFTYNAEEVENTIEEFVNNTITIPENGGYSGEYVEVHIRENNSSKISLGEVFNDTIKEWQSSDGVKYRAKLKVTNTYTSTGRDVRGVITYSVTIQKPINSTAEVGTPIAQEIKGSISKWYYTLRNFALVIMMIILIYVGIRIILSGVASEKSKYKNMLQDWFIAVCLIFVMHYIMAFSTNIVDKFIELVNTVRQNNYVENVIYDDNGMIKKGLENCKKEGSLDVNIDDIYAEDGKTLVWQTNFMGAIRLQAALKESGSMIYMGYVLCFIVLVWYTLFFLVTYLKRVVYLAFLTMMAPLVAMTYPIDKINDGKAQAFDMWLKEYIFNLLIQPLHLLLYTVLISSAYAFASSSVIYMLVAIGFLIPSEKLIRKFFGFEKAQTPGMLTGAAGAAVMMTGLNRIFRRRGNGERDSSGGNASNKDGKDSQHYHDSTGISEGTPELFELGSGGSGSGGSGSGGFGSGGFGSGGSGSGGSGSGGSGSGGFGSGGFGSGGFGSGRSGSGESGSGGFGSGGSGSGESGSGGSVSGESGSGEFGSEGSGSEGSGSGGSGSRGLRSEGSGSGGSGSRGSGSGGSGSGGSGSGRSVRKSYKGALKSAGQDYIKQKLEIAYKNNYSGRTLRRIGRGATGLATGAFAGLAGLSIGIASGDPSNAAKYAAGAAAGGYMLGSSRKPSDVNQREVEREFERGLFTDSQERKKYEMEQNRKRVLEDIDLQKEIQERRSYASLKETREKMEQYQKSIDAGFIDADNLATIMKLREDDNWSEEKALAAAYYYKQAGKRPSKMGKRDRESIEFMFRNAAIKQGVPEENLNVAVEKMINNIERYGYINDNWDQFDNT